MNTLTEIYTSLPTTAKIGVAVVVVAAGIVVSRLASTSTSSVVDGSKSPIVREDPNDVVGLPIGQHMSIKAVIDGKVVCRSYTPVSSDEDKGYFDLIIKVYDKGAMSQYIDKLKPGETIEVRGPKGQFTYTPNMHKKIGMLAGGTGITPMLQVVRAILKNPEDKTEVRLIFANVNEEDILLKKELDELAAKHPHFKVLYVLNNPPEGWKGGVGFVNQDHMREHLPPAHSDNKIVMCGPAPMNKAMESHLKSLGYLDDHIFVF
eukprot:TRINITY_DN1112_c0_g1_i1.p1 TRINITY_DN1112_c0_g1~~TRINITY_DN1112_c0_g1_i1.p1  ORF type:complete len:262 (+),score=105.12 TRINITY_DN1112_c0_g1_i1:84-869(+)